MPTLDAEPDPCREPLPRKLRYAQPTICTPQALRAASVGKLCTICSMEPLQLYRISGDLVAWPISYYQRSKGSIWRIWDPLIRKIVQASDIRFDESEFLNVVKGDAPESTVLRALIPDSMPDEPAAMEYTDTEYRGHIDYQRGGILEGSSQIQNIQQVINPSAITSMEEEVAINVLPESPALQVPASSNMKHHRIVAPLRRSTRERKRPA